MVLTLSNPLEQTHPRPVTGPEAALVLGRLPGTKRAYALPDGSGEHHLLGDQVATVIARGIDTNDLFEAVILAGGAGSVMPLHHHAGADEGLLVLDGVIELRLEGAVHLLTRGDFASIPAGSTHGYRMVAHRSRVLSFTTGGTVGSMYAALGTPVGRALPPERPGPALDETRLAAAEAAADVVFDRSGVSWDVAVSRSGQGLPDRRSPYVLRAGEGERLIAADQLFTLMATQAVTGDAFVTVMTEGPAGEMIPPHFHAEHTENFLCLDGLMTMVVNGTELHLHPGDYLQVPAGHVHAYRIDAPYTRFVGWLVPGLFEPFFRLLGEPYGPHVFPVVPAAGHFDRVMAQIGHLDLHLLPPDERPA